MSRKVDYENFMNIGVDIKARTIDFGVNSHMDTDDYGGFSVQTVNYVCRALYTMERIAKNKPIELHVTSYGGDALALLKLIDTIEAIKCPIIFIGGGIVYSSAAYLMTVCDERKVYKNTSIMLHSIRDKVDTKEDSIENIKIGVAENERVQNKLNKILGENSILPENVWPELLSRDLHLTPEECITLGIVDSIIKPVKRGGYRRKRLAQMKKSAAKDKKVAKLVQDLLTRIKSSSSVNLSINKIDEKEDKNLFVDKTTKEEIE